MYPRSRSGKLPDNEVVMAHPSVSRSHALLVVDKTLGAFLIDLGASNGSFVDGRVSNAKFLSVHTKPDFVFLVLFCLYLLLKKGRWHFRTAGACSRIVEPCARVRLD